MKTVRIEAAIIQAAALFINKKDTRAYTTRVFLDNRDDVPVVVGTDGTALAAFVVRDFFGLEGLEKAAYEVTNLGAIEKQTRQARSLTCTVELEQAAFSDWKRALPRDTQVESAVFNMDYFVRISKALKLLRYKQYLVPHIYGSHSPAVCVTDDENALFLIMPIKLPASELTYVRPAWA